MKPLKLKPVYMKCIWAGNRLQKIRNLNEHGFGISREVCAYKNLENSIAEGEFAGKNIKEIIENRHEEIMGDDPNTQLIRVAYIDAAEDLSIQVHPNEEYAQKINDYEKSESWYVLEADEGAYITAGVNIGDKAILRKAAEDGTLENYVNRIPVKQGDFVLIPAGLLHACGKNMLVVEIGSFGGITYRIYDYGRPRPLDLEKGFEALDINAKYEIKHFPLTQIQSNNCHVGVEHILFHADVIDIENEMDILSNGQYYILTCVKGNCVLQCEDELYNLSYTETIFVPASSGNIKIKGRCRILKIYYPRR